MLWIVCLFFAADLSTAFAQPDIPTEDEFVTIIKTEGVTRAAELYFSVKQECPDCTIFKRETINNLGWDYAASGELENALLLFELNIEAYPEHYDPYDSYAEAVMERGAPGDKALALAYFKKSLELNPNNENASRGIVVLGNYTKHEYMIPMRDGVRIYTQVYIPSDTSKTYPFLVLRNMYRVGHYGSTYRDRLHPNPRFAEEGFIFVYQDIRGRFMSEGDFAVLRPYIPDKQSPQDVDESSDAYDTIAWLIDNIPFHNGRVGMRGGSYSGWLTVMAMIDAHPAIKAFLTAASPSDWWLGDDAHHNGAFRLMYTFDWVGNDARPRPGGPTTFRFPWFNYGTDDGYQFFLDLGPVSNVNRKYFKGNNPTWNEYMEHGDYDDYWKKRDVTRHLENINIPVLNIAAWFDAEDFRGPLSIYRTIEEDNPANKSTLVIGPWRHGGWHGSGTSLGNIQFNQETGTFFQEAVEFPFFMYYLKDEGTLDLPEALVFKTGGNQWHSYDTWPPEVSVEKHLYLNQEGILSFTAPTDQVQSYDEYVSDPGNPVPWSAEKRNRQGHLWMVEDQRFVADRSDVLVYQSEVLEKDITIAGPIIADLFVSTTGTDTDWVVKIIDVYPEDSPDDMAGYQMLLAGDVFRSKYRNSFETPEPMVPGKVTEISFDLLDKYHTFKKAHRLMVQIQSSWFPVIDRNPQKFVDIYRASEQDFQEATHRIHHSADYPSHIRIFVIE